jgi:glycosyltransferase involved in cell wall biosynthesis
MEKKLRVLFLDTRPIRRGAQVFVQELKQRFSNEGHKVMRIFLYKEKDYEQLPLDDCDLVMPFMDDHFFEKVPTIHPLLVYKLGRTIKGFSPDVILCNGSRTLKYAAVVKRSFPGISANWIYRVIDSAVYWNKRSLTQFYYRHFVIPAMDGAVGVSQKSLDEMIQHYGFNKPSVCIPRAIDVDYFALFKPEENARIKYGVPNDAFVLLFLGNFTQQKRPDRFLDIIVGIKKAIPHVHGLMVGDGPLRKSVEIAANKLGIQDKLTFVGYQRDVRQWIAMSDLLLLTSDTEGMPGVVLEAGAMSKITISNIVGGIRELIEDGVNGYVILGGDISLFIKRVLEVYEYPNKRISFEKYNFQKISQSNSIKKIFESYLYYFKKSIST